MKAPENKKTDQRFIYLRVTVDGVRKETSTKRKWDVNRWDTKTERASGNKEDARVLNHFLDAMVTKINQFKMDLIYTEKTISAQRIIDFVLGRVSSRALVLDEFRAHNAEMLALVPKEYAMATYSRYETTLSHISEFIKAKYRTDDIEFRDLNHDFIISFEFHLKSVRNCSNNSALKYIGNFRKIINRALDKSIITQDPFRSFKKRWTKTNKRPLTSKELLTLEEHDFSSERLETIRDVFVFQCYTGLAYIDVYHLKKPDLRIGIDGEQWIITNRQKTGNGTNIPLLPKALELIEKYKEHPICLQRDSVLPVISNQKMNAYLKEIATICGLDCELNTHKARRTFGSTVTLNNDVPLHVVQQMLGHSSIRQTEAYAITEEQTVGREMLQLKNRLESKPKGIPENELATLQRLEQEIKAIKEKYNIKQP
ncbi:MAG: site-specific integrase [Bacteroidia bacterium]